MKQISRSTGVTTNIFNMNIYVGNLSYDVTEENLAELFEAYGTVSSTKIITDKYSDRSKGFGFVTMENKEEANNAIKSLNGKEYLDREMIVNEARPKKENFYR
jgi:RNA recognition motif-containing protein